ncbi:GNAT family N-acetyltransferase [Rhizobium sp. BR 314]|uniref:GNAT family N-acetyltransferase n=1 Tax=Rhizobium sp. BR 314 TaxID=3040013 RepID=UPI0039BF7CB9
MALSAVEPLNAGHDVSEFSCGKPTLDHWLKTRALSSQRKGSAAVLVIHEAGRVVGYYGLAPTVAVATVLPRDTPSGRLPDPVACLLLGQLATDRARAGQGLGTAMIRHALLRCVQVAKLFGGQALMVNAIDEEAARFWQRRGFKPSMDDSLVLFSSIACIAASLTQVS